MVISNSEEGAVDFKIGDTVRLKVGGPAMTVDKIDGDRVECVQVIKDEIVRQSFDIENLRRVDGTDFKSLITREKIEEIRAINAGRGDKN